VLTTGRGDKSAAVWGHMATVDFKVLLFSSMGEPDRANEVHDNELSVLVPHTCLLHLSSSRLILRV
jgi:hypothetical protein